ALVETGVRGIGVRVAVEDLALAEHPRVALGTKFAVQLLALRGEKLNTSWVNPTDYEPRPLD
ncbi:MAG: hypothetical protein ACKOTE_07965, partial [Opitutaceae bacterium]